MASQLYGANMCAYVRACVRVRVCEFACVRVCVFRKKEGN